MADAITTKNITSVDEVQSVDNTDKVFVNDNGSFKQISVSNLMKQAPSGVTEETDPTVSEWAKQPTKPSYTANEVGALPVGTKIPTKTSDLTNDSGYLTQIPEEYVTETELGQKGYVIEDDIPEKLPSPGTLTFTGAVNDTYDGSANKTINIPTGGGEGGTTDYNDLTNKPKLNGVTLEGNNTLDQVGVLAKNQGSNNSGKYLSVGSDGNVVPVDAPSGGTVDTEQIEQAVNSYLEKNPVSGMTSDQIMALDGMLKLCAFTENPSNQYTMFCKAFGIGIQEPEPSREIYLSEYCVFESPAPGIAGGDKRIGVKVSYSFEEGDTIKLISPIGDNYMLAVGSGNYEGPWIGGGYLDSSNEHTFSDLDISGGYGKVLLIKRTDEAVIQQDDIDNIKICLVVIKHG